MSEVIQSNPETVFKDTFAEFVKAHCYIDERENPLRGDIESGVWKITAATGLVPCDTVKFTVFDINPDDEDDEDYHRPGYAINLAYEDEDILTVFVCQSTFTSGFGEGNEGEYPYSEKLAANLIERLAMHEANGQLIRADQ